MIKVLSIDWDSFFDMTTFLPGSCGILAPAWAFMYRRYNDGFASEFKFFYDEYNKVKEFIMAYNKTLYVAKNHQDILEVLPQNETIEITNLDFHDDMASYLGQGKVTPGNWISALKHTKDNKVSVKWYQLATKSRVQSGYYEECLSSIDNISCHHFIGLDDVILNETYDFVFICQSPEWSPSHMNHRFKELISTSKKIIFINEPIYNTFLDEIEIIKKAIPIVYIQEDMDLPKEVENALYDREDEQEEGPDEYIIITRDLLILDNIDDVDPYYVDKNTEDIFQLSCNF